MEDMPLPSGGLVRPDGASGSLDGTDASAPVSQYAIGQKDYPLETLEVRAQGDGGAGAAYAATLRSVPFSRRKATIVSLIITIVVMILTGVTAAFFVDRERAQEEALRNSIPVQDVSLENASEAELPRELEETEDALLVNGDIIARGDLRVVSGSFISVLSTQELTADQAIALPNASGTICLDVNNCNFASTADLGPINAQLAQLSTQLGQIIIPPQGVTSLNDQNGAVSIQGSVNRITVATANGTITLSTPQDLDANANVQFGNLTLGAAGTVTANALQQTGAGSDLAINAGADSITFSANGRTYVFPNSGALSQTICTTIGNCGGSGGAVTDVNGETGSITLQGTANQITVSTGAGTVTFSTPQNINTTSSPTFAGLTLTAPLGIASGGTGVSTVPANGRLLIGNGTGYTVATLTQGTGITIANGAGSITITSTLGTSVDTTEITDGTILEVDLSSTNAPTDNYILSYDQGTGGFTWVDPTTVGGPSVTSLRTLTGDLDLVGTAGQITVSDDTVDTITLSLDANISLLGQTIGNSEIENNAVQLTTQTTGNYQAGTTAGNGIGVTGAAGEGWTPVVALGPLTANWDQTGAFDIVLNNAASELRILENTGGTFFATLDVGDLSADQSFTFLQGGTVVTSSNVSTFATTGVSAGAGLTGGGATGALTLDIGAGNGITVNANDLTLALQANKGLEVDGSGLSLIDCSSGQILKYNGSNQWVCDTDAGGSGVGDDITVNSSAATNANFLNTAASGTEAAVSWTLNTVSNPDDISISVGNASATEAGTVTTGVQIFAGAKTFNGQITAGAGVSLGSQTLQGTTAVIDFTNFDVSSAGAVTAAGDVIVQGGDLTVGTVLQVSNFIMHDGDGETITWTLPDVTASYTLTLPDAVGSANQCLKAQNGSGALFWDNCTGGSGGGLSGSGTTNRVAKFTPNGTTLGDSTISDNGTAVTVNGNVNLAVQGTTVTVGVGSTRTGSIVLNNATNNNTVTLQSGTTSASYALTLPTAVGSANQCLKAQDGSGTLFWEDCLGGGGGGGITSVDGQTGPAIAINNASGAANTITIDNAVADGTTKGIAAFNATNFSASSGVVNTIQDISTGATPQFAGMTLTGNLGMGANTITGTTAVIDFTNFDVSGVGAVTAVGVNAGSGLLQGTGGFTVTGTTSMNTTGAANTSIGNATGTLALTSSGLNVTTAGAVSGVTTLNASGAVTAGTYNNQTISNAASLTGTLNVAGVTTLQSTLTVQGASATIGGALQQGSLILHDGNGQTATISVGSALVANTALAIPTAVGASDTFCLQTLANCTGATGNSFETINAPSGGDPVADSSTDTLNLTVTGTNLTVNGNSTTDTLDFDLVESVLAGNGLAANGSALDINTGNGLELNTDAVRVNQDFSFGWTADHTWTLVNAEDLAVASTLTGTTSADPFNLTMTNQTTSGTQRGLTVTNADDAANATTEALISVINAEGAASTVTDGLVVSGTAGAGLDTIVDGVDVSDDNITNGVNVGSNFLLGNGIRQFSSSATVWTFEDTSGNDLLTVTDAGTTGNILATGNFQVNGTTTLGDGAADSLTIHGTTVNVQNNLNFDGGTFFIDSSTNRVGIGTTSLDVVLKVEDPSQPAQVSGNGTNATETLRVTGGKGGDTTGTTGQTAGTGGELNLFGGEGGDAPSGSTNGSGGSIYLQGGAPGAGAGAAGFYGGVNLQLDGGGTGVGLVSDDDIALRAGNEAIGTATGKEAFSAEKVHDIGDNETATSVTDIATFILNGNIGANGDLLGGAGSGTEINIGNSILNFNMNSGSVIDAVVNGYAANMHLENTGGALDAYRGFYVGIPNIEGTTVVTDYYGLYIDTLDSGASVTNGYGIYQAGSSDVNFFAGQIQAATGSAAAPSHSFNGTGNTDNGMWRSGTDILGFSAGGTNRLNISSAGLLPAAASTYDLGSTTTEFDELYVGDDNGIRLGLDQDATLAYDEATDDRVELTGSGASLFVEDKLGFGKQNVPTAAGGVGSEAVTVTASFLAVTATDDGDTIQLSETGAKDGDIVVIINVDTTATDTVNIDDINGQVELTADPVALDQNDSITLMYSSDRSAWIQLSTSNNL